MLPRRYCQLPHCNERPAGTRIDTFVVHSIYAGPNNKQSEEFDSEACIRLLDENKVTTHFLIDRAGNIWQLVEESKRAWHAGESCMPFPDDNRTNVNDFSLGAELIASPGSGFTDDQYTALAELIAELSATLPIKSVVGHDHIAPGRKFDPGPKFDWPKLRGLLGVAGLTSLKFAV